MKATRPGFLILALAVALAIVSPALGEAPDCTGISGVFNTDPNLQDELIGIRVASGLSDPVGLAFAPGDNERMFVVQQGGLIRLVKGSAVTTFLSVPVLGGSERGLLGLAFHPDYQTNGHFFVYYTATSPGGAVTIARYTRSTDDVADPASAQIVFQVTHPISNHNGGGIAFGPDGHLYFGIGDGGSACDPGTFPGNSQKLTSHLGKMLRLNVDSLPYTTAGNPFDGATPGLDEIWYYGLRNPWRWSFDRVTGAMYIGDVGQNQREEVDCNPDNIAPKNFGWNAYEGFNCDTCNEWVEPCPIDLVDYVAPILDYSLAGPPCAVIGGYVYRGCRMADLRGSYFYSDACDDFVNTFRTNEFCQAGPVLPRENDLEPGGNIAISSIVSFGEDNQGEVYLVDNANGVGGQGEIYKILPQLSIMELSGQGATPFTMNANGDFVWEDLGQASDNPVRFFKTYRATASVPGIGPGPFSCIHIQSSNSTSWSGGDPQTPASEQVFYYLVTGQNIGGEETVAGAGSDGTLRIVDTASPCN